MATGGKKNLVVLLAARRRDANMRALLGNHDTSKSNVQINVTAEDRLHDLDTVRVRGAPDEGKCAHAF